MRPWSNPGRNVAMRPRHGAAGTLATLALAAGLGLAGCVGDGSADAPPPPGTAAVVELTSTLAFRPASVSIAAGEVVEWRNISLFTHTVTDEPMLARRPADAGLPQGALAFSGRLAPGAVYRHRFAVPGTYHYFCMPYERFGMLGRVVVRPPG